MCIEFSTEAKSIFRVIKTGGPLGIIDEKLQKRGHWIQLTLFQSIENVIPAKTVSREYAFVNMTFDFFTFDRAPSSTQNTSWCRPIVIDIFIRRLKRCCAALIQLYTSQTVGGHHSTKRLMFRRQSSLDTLWNELIDATSTNFHISLFRVVSNFERSWMFNIQYK